MAKVSIIIPTYNVEEYLDECLQSAVRQTLSDIEIICVNDGSTDSSLEILEKYARQDERIVIIDQPNGGYGKAMNAGLDRATGEYIGIIEPDDYVALDMYEDLYRIAKENDLDFVKSDFYRFVTDETGDRSFKYYQLSPKEEDYHKVFSPCDTPETLNYVMNTWCGIYKRSFLEEFGIRHNETPGASFQDNGFYFQTFMYGRRAMIIDKAYYCNRRDNPNSSVHNPEKVYAANIEYDYIRGMLMENPEKWKKFKYMYWKKRFTNTVTTIERIGPEYKKEYCRNASREFNAAQKDGLIRKKDYEDNLWKKMQMILKDPDSFALLNMEDYTAKDGTRVSNAELDKLRKDSRRLNDILNSNSYKLGFTLTAVPRFMKESAKKVMKDPKKAMKSLKNKISR